MAAANLRRLGLHRKGLPWQQGVFLYKTFVRPCMEYGLALIPPTSVLVSGLDLIQLSVLRETTRAPRNTSHAVLLRLANCTHMLQRARELAAGWLARVENAPAQHAIAWFWRVARNRSDWPSSIFGRLERGNAVIRWHRQDVKQRKKEAFWLVDHPQEAYVRRMFGGRHERWRQNWAIRPPPDHVIMARTIRTGRMAWWMGVRRKAMLLAEQDGRGTALPMGLPYDFRPIPLLTYKGPAWVTRLLLLWWTGRLPSYDTSINCSKCAGGHRSRIHVIECHRIWLRLQLAGFRRGEELHPRSIVHPLDQALQQIHTYSLKHRRFRVVMSILRAMAFHDHRLNQKHYRGLGARLPPPPPPPERIWQWQSPYEA